MKESKIQWHPAFAATLQIELRQDMDKLTFETEHQLTKKPQSIDILIIKKEKDAIISKNIGKHFKEHNIIEYKAPDDYLSINDFYKVYGYACIYQADTEKVGQINPSEITITLVCNRLPVKMLKHLEKIRNIQLIQLESGIYELCGDPFKIYLIITKNLSKKENLWLNSLRTDLTAIDDIIPILEDYRSHKNSNIYQAVIDVITRSNMTQLQEAKKMSSALLELMEDELQKSKEEGIQAGIQTGIRATVEVSKQLGASKEQSISMVMEKYEITLEQAAEYVEKYW